MADGDDLESAAQLRRWRPEPLLELLQALDEAALLLAQFFDAFGARPRPGLQPPLHAGDLALHRLHLVHRGAYAIDQMANHRALKMDRPHLPRDPHHEASQLP